ncbi:telomerase protein component 1, partial [Schistosoma bovis]
MTGWIELKGLVDNVFKYLSLPDDKCLVEQIDKIDETYKLNSMFDLPLQMNLSSEQQGHNKLSQIKSSQDSFCRVYISSSYIDMHAEHDLIYHTLVPNLCQNVAQTCSTCLNLVDLRIGVPESITCSLIALEMYLKQAAASDIFILLLGDKYGWVPDESLVRALPDSLLAEVNKFYKPGMSVTEMEYHMVKLAAVNKLSRSSFNMFPSTVFVFIRDFNTRISHTPMMNNLLYNPFDSLLSMRRVLVCKYYQINSCCNFSYSARFIGVIDDRPMMGNLDNFANQFISTLESTLKRLYYNPVNDAIKSPMVTSSDDNDELIDISEFLATYVNPIACNISPRHLLNIQHAFKKMVGKCVPTYFTGQHRKSDESSNTTSKNVRIEDRTSNDQNENGRILVITGSPGSGKTVHLAALAMSLATSDHHSTLMSSKDYTRSTSTTRKSMSNSQSLAKYQILIHFTNGIPSTGLPSCKQLSKVLDHWIKCLAAQLQSSFSSSNILKMFLSKIKVNLDSTNTANDHHNLKLKMLCFNKMIWFLGCIPGLNYAFLIDDVDYLDPLILDDWLPPVLPKNVQFIFTCHSNSEIIQKLTCQYNKNTCSVYQIPQLTSEESRAVILSHLHSNGVSCVHSQLEYEIASLISACESNNPSYFNMVKSHLKMLSGTIDQLIDEIIKNLEVEYKNDLIIATLGFLIFCRHSLSSKELLILLNEWLFTTQNINEKYEMNWENNPWKMLSVIQDKPNDLESICTLESNIDRFILSKRTNNLCALDKSKRLHLTPLAFHILLSRLRPLMIIFNKSLHCFNSTSNGSNNNNSNVISTEKMTLNGKIELWNLGAENLSFLTTTDRCIQEKWKRKLELCPFIDKIDAMKRFICVNYEFLVKYPNSFCELAINQDSSEWIHTLGLSLLYLNDFGIQRQLDMNNSQILFRVNSPKCTLIKPMQRNMTYKPIVTSNGSMDVPTSVEVNSTAKVLVYGTRCGTITFVELSTMRELWSLTGHRSSVQSLCFLDGFPSKPENIKSPEKFISELRLMSASEDGDVYIWDASTVIHNVESKVHDKTVISQLASLCGYHRRCVTTSAWHPRRRLVATGDLDCMVYLWDVSEIDVKSSDLSTSVCSSLSASTSLCSLAYSPNGGNILATFDKDGVLMLWNDNILWYQGGLIQEYSCFTIEYFPYDQTDQLIPNQYGKICFSKPNGQYIFQSGGGQFLNNYINIWDTGLWGTFGPWINVKPPQIGSGNPICVTCLTILPTYEHVLIGWSNGDLTVIRVFDGRLIHYLKAATEDNSSIQCITSSCARSFSAFDAYHIIVGYASGAVRIFLCILRPKVSPHKDRYVYQSANAMSEFHFQLIDTLWSHCLNHNVNGGVPENGGTLCVASDFCVAVTGGGNAETWVHFIGRQTGSKIKKSVCLKEHNSAVIAVSMDSKFFATASKSRQLALYKFDPLERTVTLWHLINDVGTAPITSFYLLRMFLGVDTISISVYIGDSNSLLHNYAIIDKKFQLKQTFDANKSPIKFMERVSNHLFAASDDGEVSVWKHDKHGALQFSHRLNVCTDMPSKNNSNNSTLEESYYLTGFFTFLDRYDSLKFERKLCSPTIETIDKLMISKADNQHTESDDEVKDPDSEVTSLSGCCMSNSNSYVTGSDQKIYECGYKIHIDIEERNKTYFIATDYLKDEQFHLLNSCKKGYIVYRETSYDATYRLLYGVRLSCNKSSDCSQVIQDFCYRTFAPFILQYRGTLKGHSGLVPCTLTSGCTTNSDEDCIVASASGRTVCDVGCDIRLWSIPSKRKLLNYQPNQHFGPITCLGQLKITDHYSICISGCMDGSVMFWSFKNSEPLDLKHVSVADLTNNKSIKWKPLLHGFCSALRPKYAISDIATQTYVMDESKRTVQYLIYIAYGEKLWRMRIILDQSNMSMNDVQNTFERLFSMNGKTELHFSELDVFWSSELDIPCSDIASFTASHPIVKISPRYAEPNELEQCEVIAVLVNGDVIVLTSNEHEKFSFDQCIVE